MSEATVKAHVSRIMAKLGAANRVQVAITARDAGLVLSLAQFSFREICANGDGAPRVIRCIVD